MARPSRIAEAIRTLMAAEGRHAWTLEEIQADLAGLGVAADFSSVFRAAERLEGEGTLRRLHVDEGPPRFEPSGAHHDHLLCTGCGCLIPVSCLGRRIDIMALEAETGFAVTTHDIVLSGLCRGCRAP
jgi:Fur family ferric uptake transcriptional regulator